MTRPPRFRRAGWLALALTVLGQVLRRTPSNCVKAPPVCRLSPVALQILQYLEAHRDARDTLEGIAEWWLLEQRIRQVIVEVKQAMAELLEQGLVRESIGRDGRVHYQIDPMAGGEAGPRKSRPAKKRNAASRK